MPDPRGDSENGTTPAKAQKTVHYKSMVTTIIAIYGAVVATVSTLLGAWYFARSGPSLQAQASVDPVAIGEEIDREWDDIRHILLEVWNAGRAEVTVRYHCSRDSSRQRASYRLSP